MLREYKDEIEKLKAMLAQAAGGAPVAAAAPAAAAPAAPAAVSPMDFAAMAGDGGGGDDPLSRTAELDEALKAKENEIAEERRQREELAERLATLMGKMQGQGAAAPTPLPLDSSGTLPAALQIAPTVDQIEKAEMERAELERVHHERVRKAKKRAEKKASAGMARLAKEKEAMADELNELRAMLEEGQNGSDNQVYIYARTCSYRLSRY